MIVFVESKKADHTQTDFAMFLDHGASQIQIYLGNGLIETRPSSSARYFAPTSLFGKQQAIIADESSPFYHSFSLLCQSKMYKHITSISESQPPDR
jgi:hypothetical protein